MEEWVVSQDGDSWNDDHTFYTRDAAIKKGRKALGISLDESFYIGRKVLPTIPSVDAHQIIRQLAEESYFSSGMTHTDWLDDITETQTLILSALLDSQISMWLLHIKKVPDWFEVIDVDQVKPE